MLKKFFAAIIFAALISVNNCYAAFEAVATTSIDSDSWFLAIIKNSDNDYYFAMVNKQNQQGAIVPYERKLYNFYFNKEQYGYPPLIFIMGVQDSPRDVDANLGEWSGDFHLLPVYSNFEYENGRVIPETYPTSGVGLHPSHYQARIQSPYHVKLVKVFMTKMPELHRVVESNGINLP